MRRWLVFLALLLSLGINVGLVTALVLERRQGWRPPMAGQPPAPGVGLRRLADQLALDPDQRQRFSRLHQRFFAESRPLREELGRVRENLRRALMAEQPDRAEIDRLLSASGELTEQLDRRFVATVLEAGEFLSVEQRNRFLFFLQRQRAPRQAVRDGILRRLRGEPPPAPAPPP
jgi:Spy/CpxP family protein refolding chaperone